MSKIPRYWSYPIGQRVRVNEAADYFYPGITGREGIIMEHVEQGLIDYGVKLGCGGLYRLREHELDVIPNEVNK